MRILTGARWRGWLARTVAATGMAAALVLGASGSAPAAHAQRAVDFEVGCVDWSADAGCTRMSLIVLYDDGSYTVFYFSPSN
jgi:hypothetical protein